MKIRPAEPKFLLADRQTDVTMATEIFCNFTKGPKMSGAEYPLTLTPLFMDRNSSYFTFQS
jgi:hypothetical protein